MWAGKVTPEGDVNREVKREDPIKYRGKCLDRNPNGSLTVLMLINVFHV
jgi:hypothetical protein